MRRLTTNGLTEFGIWLLTEGYFGHGLLAIHGCQMGFKLKDQLEMSWADLMDQNHNPKDSVELTGDIPREMNPFVQLITKEVFEKVNHQHDLTLPVYVKKSGDQITNHNLKVELNRYWERFKKQKKVNQNKFLIQVEGKELKDPIRSQDFEHAWARDYLASKKFNLEAFKVLSRAMKHRSLEHTINLYGVAPKDDVEDYGFRFNYYVPFGFESTERKRQDFIVSNEDSFQSAFDEIKKIGNEVISKIKEA